MIKSAFTLIEMLVATLVFTIGFIAVYSLFIAGVNYRYDADRLTNTALAATSLISNWRLQMQDQWVEVDDFVGDGDPLTAETGTDSFYPYPDNPRIWYRINKATDAAGQTGSDTDTSSSVRIELLLMDMGSVPSALTLADIQQRQFVDPTNPNDLNYINTTFPNSLPADALAAYTALDSRTDPAMEKSLFILRWRKVLARHEAVILRR